MEVPSAEAIDVNWLQLIAPVNVPGRLIAVPDLSRWAMRSIEELLEDAQPTVHAPVAVVAPVPGWTTPNDVAAAPTQPLVSWIALGMSAVTTVELDAAGAPPAVASASARANAAAADARRAADRRRWLVVAGGTNLCIGRIVRAHEGGVQSGSETGEFVGSRHTEPVRFASDRRRNRDDCMISATARKAISMHIVGTSPASVRTDVPAAPTTRQEAAQALAALPVGVVTVASMTAMTKAMAGEAASRADLVLPILEKLTPKAAKVAMLDAIDGAIAVMPELSERDESLRQAAAGLEALLTEAAADTAQGDAQDALGRLTTPLEPLMAPVMEAVLLLDPTFGQEPEQG